MKNSHIEWCDHTFNPWEGCTKVSPGCAHCYAETRNRRFAGGKNWGPGAPRRRTIEANWRQPLAWNRQYVCGKCGKFSPRGSDDCGHCQASALRRPLVFCASLADWLDDEVPIEWLADLLDLIRRTPNLDWLLLTKRPQNWSRSLRTVREWLHARSEAGGPDGIALFNWVNCWIVAGVNACLPPANVWIGTTVEDQQRADERIPALLKIPARVRFLSCEPLLGALEFSNVTKRADCVAQLGKPALDGIHWVICGGESGPGARPMHPDWARSVRNQCAAVGVPFFFKQWGENLPYAQTHYVVNPEQQAAYAKAITAGKVSYYGYREVPAPDGGMMTGTTPGVRPESYATVGKKAAGRLLDGKEHSAFPTS